MFEPKHYNGVAPYPNTAQPESEEHSVPIDPIVQRDLDVRELAGTARFFLALTVAVAAFFILVFGILGAVADVIGDVLGLHQNYPNVVGTH